MRSILGLDLMELSVESLIAAFGAWLYGAELYDALMYGVTLGASFAGTQIVMGAINPSLPAVLIELQKTIGTDVLGIAVFALIDSLVFVGSFEWDVITRDAIIAAIALFVGKYINTEILHGSLILGNVGAAEYRQSKDEAVLAAVESRGNPNAYIVQ